jgi:hypothetical protein
MYCENIAEAFGENLVGTWCHEDGDALPLAPGLDGSPSAYREKIENVQNLSGQRTIIGWVSLDKTERIYPIACLRSSEQDIDAGWHLWILGNGQIQFGTGDGSLDHERVMFPFSLRERNVAFIAVVVDAVAAHIFCNSQRTDPHYLSGYEKPADTLYIGQDPVLPWNELKGSLQCVSIFDRALTDEEVLSIYNDGWTMHSDEAPEQAE